MYELEGFYEVLSCITLVKGLHDINRLDVIGQFSDVLSWESFFEVTHGIISSIFDGYTCDYDEENEVELMEFTDDVISNYFIHAWEYGKLNNLHYSQNPYIPQAKSEINDWFYRSCCIDWKLLSYIRTKKSAQKSKLLIHAYTGCGGCNKQENLVNGLIQLYSWFSNKCKEFEAMKIASNNLQEDMPFIKADCEEGIAA